MIHKFSSFELLHKKVQNWIWKQGWTSLKEIQENSIPIVLKKNCDVIICAPTAGGKTEAAFLPIISNILFEDSDTLGYDVLYISPLKALINDQYRRLCDITKDLKISVTPWHGDISLSIKRRSLKKPSGILIITPESLESFLVNKNSEVKSAFGNLKYIVIDELHAFIGNERGKHLQSLLSRIEFFTNKAIPRIAMSATFSNYDSVKNFLRQDNTLNCVVPHQGDSNHEIRLIIKNYNPSSNVNIEKEISQEIFSKLRGSNNLVFTNGRFESELYTLLLNSLSEKHCIPNEFHTHHGNLSKFLRENIERELQLGQTPITAICTSTLELGVDIGNVKSIAQIGVANSVSALRQRIGRSGRRGEPSILRIFSIENSNGILYELRANLVQNIAVIELLREHKYESPNIGKFHLSTLIQQILSLLASHNGFYPKEGWEFLCKNGAFKNITPSMFLMLLKALGNNNVISQLNNGQIIIGNEGEKLISQLDFYTAFITSDNFCVINSYDSSTIGEVSILPQVGELIILAGRSWIVNTIDRKRSYIYVSLAQGKGNIYFDVNGAEIDGIITRKMKEIYTNNLFFPYLDNKTNCHYELECARKFFINNNMDKSPFIRYGDDTILMTWVGVTINRTIALIYEYMFGKRVGYNELMLIGITQEDINKILFHNKPKLKQLASLVNRNNKIKQKYDYLLSDELLNMEYGRAYLNLDKAWEILELYQKPLSKSR